LTSSFYPPYHVGGACIHVKLLAEELARRGHEVHILFSMDAYNMKGKTARAEAESERIFTHPIKTGLSLSPYAAYVLGSSRPVIRNFRSLMQEVKPQIVHHHNVSLLGYDILAKRGNYLNLYTAHDYWLICPQSTLLRARSKVCETASCTFCGLPNGRPPQLWRKLASFASAVESLDVIISPSEYARARIAKKFEARSTTIPNFAPNPPHSIPPSGMSDFFLFVGRLEHYKGILGLIRGYGQIEKQLASKLVIVGQGPLAEPMHDSIRKYDTRHRIVYLEGIDRSVLYGLLRDARALIVPSIWPENCPLVALEALSVGTPVLGTNLGGLPEIIMKIDKQLVFGSLTELEDILLQFDAIRYTRRDLRGIYEKYYAPAVYMQEYEKLVSSATSGSSQRMT